MKNKYKNLSKNTLLFTISSFGSKFLSFLLVPLYTYILSTAEYGTIDLLNTTVQLLIPIFTVNIQDAVLRFCLDDDYDNHEVLSISFLILFIGSTVLGVILFFIRNIGFVELNNEYLLFLFLSFLLGAINNILNMYLKGENKISLIVFFGLFNTFITLVLNIVLLLFFKMGIIGYMFSNVLGLLLSDLGILFFGKICNKIRYKKLRFITIKSMLFYSLPLVINSIGWWINNASDRYIMAIFCNTSVIGIYAIAYKIPSILSTIQSIFYNAWSVSAITEYDKTDKDGFMGNVFSIYTVLIFISTSLILLLNTKIAALLYAKEFYQAWKFVPFLLLGTVFNGLGLFIGCLFTATKKTKEISITTIIGAFLNTLLNFILIPLIGGIGAALATMIGYFFVWVLRQLYIRRFICLKVNWKIEVSCIFFLFIQATVSSIFDSFLYQVPFFSILCFLKRHSIYTIVNSLKSIIHKGRI